MKKFSTEIKRVLSMLLALMLVFSIVAEPGGMLLTRAKSDADTSSTLSTPVYTHAMDALAPESDGNVVYENYYPAGWLYSNKYNNINASTIVSVGTDMYYQMKMGASNTSRDSLAYYTFTAGDSVGGNAALKYRLMVDNSAVTETWKVYIPILASSGTGRTLSLTIAPSGTDGVYTLSDGTNTYAWTEGQWYDVELIISNDGKAWALWVDGEQVFSGTKKEAYKVTNEYINMGIVKGANAGVSLCVDDLKVYNYTAGTGFSFAQSTYEVEAGSTVTPVWNVAPANAYIPSVTYSSSDELVATVDASTGVVTGVAAGTSTITATPAPSSGLSAATVTVIVTGGQQGENENPSSTVLSTPVYSHDMDTSSSQVPTGWLRNGQFAKASTNPTATFDGVSRTYYHMERNGTEGNAASRAYYQNQTAYTAAVLKYDIMLDNSGLTGWTVYAPSFVNGAGNRSIGINLTDTMQYGDVQLVAGKWHTVELVVAGTAWSVYVDGVNAKSGTITQVVSEALCYINMGIANAGGDTTGGKVAGAGVSMNIDNLAVYNFAANATFAAAQNSYELDIGDTLALGWTKTPAEAYLTKVTYSSSNEQVATVNPDTGVVTGIAAGTVTITATPAASSGMSAAQTTVVVGGGESEEQPDSASGKPLYYHPMNALAATHENCSYAQFYPDN